MTVDELHALIGQGDLHATLAALDHVDEFSRPKLAKAALKVARKWGAEIYTYQEGETLAEFTERHKNQPRCLQCAALATYRLGVWEDIQKLEKVIRYALSSDGLGEVIELLLPSYTQRPPDWIGKWVELILDRPQGLEWSWIRRLMKAGVIGRPATDSYIRRMPRDVDSLRADPDALQDELYCLIRLLPLGNSALIESADIDHASEPGMGEWSLAATLQQLLAEGLVDRSRLLAVSLEALQLGRRANDALWFYRFHELLAPTLDERSALQPVYCDLLTGGVSPVVSFALDAIGELAKAGRLDQARFVSVAGRVFDLKTKGPATVALKLLSQIAKADKSLRNEVALAAVVGLSHETPDVQKSVLALLEGLNLEPDARLAAAIDGRSTSVVASLKDRLKQLLDKLTDGESRPLSEPAVVALLVDSESRAKLDSVVRHPSRLAPDRALVPIQTLDELITEASAAIENLRDSEQLERVLDGMSRLCDQRPDDFAVRTAPLLKRIRKLTTDSTLPHYTQLGLVGGLMQFVEDWLTGKSQERVATAVVEELEPAPPPPIFHDEYSVGQVAEVLGRRKRTPVFIGTGIGEPIIMYFLHARLRELAERLRKCDARPLLAAPTHRGGWIDPRVFVERLRIYEEAGLDPQSFDVRQALLRLAPEDRDSVLSQMTELTGSRQQVAEWALGKRKPTLSGEAAIYIAATAARDPFAPLSASDSPPLLKPLTLAWTVSRTQYPWTDAPGWAMTLKIDPNPFANPLFRYAPWTLWTIAHHAATIKWTAGKAARLAQIWPIHPEPFFAAGAVAVISELESTSNDVRHLPEFLHPLLDPQTPFSEMAQVILAASLLAKSADQRGLAVDVLIAVIADGRCQGPELGTILRRLLPCGMVRCKRLSESFNTICRASSRHLQACSQIVQSLFGVLDTMPDDAHHLLTPLLDWITELRQPIEPSFRASLVTITGSGKAAKLARTLLK